MYPEIGFSVKDSGRNKELYLKKKPIGETGAKAYNFKGASHEESGHVGAHVAGP